jgi:hypothetical protein
MPVVLLLFGVVSGLAAAIAGLIAGLPVPTALALYLGAGSLSVLTGGAVALAAAMRGDGAARD